MTTSPTFQDRNRYVCLEIADFSPAENQKKHHAETVGLHAILPMTGLLQRVISPHMLGRPKPQEHLGQVLPVNDSDNWNPLRERSAGLNLQALIPSQKSAHHPRAAYFWLALPFAFAFTFGAGVSSRFNNANRRVSLKPIRPYTPSKAFCPVQIT